MAFLDFARGMIGIAGFNRKPSPVREVGVPGYAVYNGWLVSKERNPKLVGQNRYITASNILTNISIVAAGTRYFLNLLSKPSWQVEPADDSAEAEQVAEFVQSVIDGTNTGWTRIIRRSGMYKYHGFGIQEWTAKKRDDGKIGILDIEPRPQHTIERWDMEANGDVLGVIQRGVQDGQEYYLPRQKIIYLVDDTLTDNPEGLGWFRQLVDPAERMTEYLRLEKVGFQKDLGGIPIGRAPISEILSLVGTPKAGGGVWTEADVTSQLAGMQNFMNMETRDNTTGMILDSRPYQDVTDSGDRTTSVMKWGLDLLTGKAEAMPEMGEAILRLTQDMARIMGIENILTGSEGVGSQALSKDKSQNLYLAVNATIGDMRESYERDIIHPICDMNGIPEKLRPRFKVEDVAFKDAESIAVVLRDMASAGAVMMPDDPAIDDIRALMGISPQPEIDPAMLAAMNPVKPTTGEKSKDDELPDNPEDTAKAAPRPLYVCRKLVNAKEFLAWAKAQGFETTVPDDELHVTVTYSRKAVDWLKMGTTWEGDEKGNITVMPGGARIVERLGDQGAVVLMFTSSSLSWRHEEMVQAGASWDYDEYQPHVTITYSVSPDMDLSKVEPYRGPLIFGPEIFEPFDDDWKDGVTEQ